MKILLSAFACLPERGSEPGVGWRWALELSNNHQVVVVSDVVWCAGIKAHLKQIQKVNLVFEFFRPIILRRVPLYSKNYQHFFYTIWQISLLKYARQLHKKYNFDLVIHLTYGVFRHPSFLGYLGIPFVLGPLGGGEDAPKILKRSIRGKARVKDLLRSISNKVSLFDPLLWIAMTKANIILCKTKETLNSLPWPFRKRAILFSEIGIDVPNVHEIPSRNSNDSMKVLFAGRLESFKGIHLAIRAVAKARELGAKIQFTLVGQGPYEQELRDLSQKVNIDNEIIWKGHISQQELFKLYRESHCFLFPSLRDASGNVVLEAQAFGCPVICLDFGGPVTLVTKDTAMIVSTVRADEEDVVNRLADCLKTFWEKEGMRYSMGRAARLHAQLMTWQSRANELIKIAAEL